MSTVAPARKPLVCSICKTAMVSKAIHTDVPGAQGVAVGQCPSCDHRRCSIGDCRALVRDPFARRCPRGHVL